MPTGLPIPGALQPIAYQYKHQSDEDAIVMDLLVTSYIKQNVVIGFRFFPRAEGYRSQFSSTVTFCLLTSLLPGQYVRLAKNGSELHLFENADVTAVPKLAGKATTPPFVRDYASALVFWTPALNTVDAIAFIGFRVQVAASAEDAEIADDESAYDYLMPVPPPTDVLPCQFSTVVTLYMNVTSELHLVAYSGKRTGIPGHWIDAWKILKLGGRNEWQPVPQIKYEETIDALRATLFVALNPGQVIPVAYRPYNPLDYGFAAQLSLMVTEAIPPNAYFWVAPNCSSVDTVRSGPVWKWVAPCDKPVLPGMVIDLTGLGLDKNAHANIGTLYVMGTWPVVDFAITSFTVYAYSENASTDATIYPVTAVYTCGSDCHLPLGLTPGQTVSALPWPACGAIIPLDCTRPVADWGVQRQIIANSQTERWLCQPLRCLRSASACPEPVYRGCVDAPSTIGVYMSGSCPRK